MAEQLSMDDILSEKPAEKPVQVETTKPDTPVEAKEPAPVERPTSGKKAWQDKEQAARGLVRDPETGQFSPKEEKAEEKPVEKLEVEKPVEKVVEKAPTQDLTDKEKAFLKAMHEERGKRQELEKRLQAIETAKPQEPEKTFFDDPDGALAKRDEAFTKQITDIKAEIVTSRLNTAEFLFRRDHKDFDEKIEVFGGLLKQTPGLYQQWMGSPDPAEFAYNLGKTHLELKEAGGIPELRAKIEKETRIKLEAELKDKAEALAKERAALPPSLSDARSTGVNRPTWGGVPTMEEILKG